MDELLWSECWSERHKKAYYMNELTGEVAWERPRNSAEHKRKRKYLVEDNAEVAIQREKLRDQCLETLCRVNEKYGSMGDSKTGRSCARDGMKVGMQGIYSRIVWTQLLEQIRRHGDIGYSSRDPIFPLEVYPDEAVTKELLEANRTLDQANTVYLSVADDLKKSSSQLIRLARQLQEKEITILLYNADKIPILKPEEIKAKVIYLVTYQTAQYEIRGDYLLKLHKLYCLHTAPDCSLLANTFLHRVFCVLARYDTLSGSSEGYQMAFPSSGFAWLRHHLGVTVECFASPLNVYNQSFCSVAYDTDRFFGSLGNFFAYDVSDVGLEGRSFEANPPFVESVMEHMARKIEMILTLYKSSQVPISFSVIVPGWDDEKCVSYGIMSTSAFARPHAGYKLVLDKKQHNYRPGMQHRATRDEQPSNVVTNEAGARRWPVTDGLANELRAQLAAETGVR